MPLSNLPPNAGEGLHDFILRFTRREVISGQSPEDVKDECWQLTKSKGRPSEILSKEIDDAVQGAVGWLAKHPGAAYSNANGERRLSRFWEYQDRISDGIRRPPPWSRWQLPLDKKLIARILSRRDMGKLKPRQTFDLAELYARFNFNLCLAKEVNHPVARPLRYWSEYDLGAMQWMVPNPCWRCGQGGGVKNDLNAGERIWLIIEFDTLSLEEQAKLLLWLERAHAEWDLAMIVYSGGKSLHGWFSTVGKLEHKEIIRFFRVATSLGCDKMMRSSVQYTRMPLGWNWKTDQRQQIIHWNSEAFEIHNDNLNQLLDEDEED